MSRVGSRSGLSSANPSSAASLRSSMTGISRTGSQAGSAAGSSGGGTVGRSGSGSGVGTDGRSGGGGSSGGGTGGQLTPEETVQQIAAETRKATEGLYQKLKKATMVLAAIAALAAVVFMVLMLTRYLLIGFRATVRRTSGGTTSAEEVGIVPFSTVYIVLTQLGRVGISIFGFFAAKQEKFYWLIGYFIVGIIYEAVLYFHWVAAIIALLPLLVAFAFAFLMKRREPPKIVLREEVEVIEV